MSQLFVYQHRMVSLAEYYQNGAFYFLLQNKEEERVLSLYPIDLKKENERNLYMGYTKEEVLASGRDLLGEKLTEGGDPDYRTVKSVLPPLSKDTYTVLGGIASVAELTVDACGRVYPQISGTNRNSEAIFVPSEYDPELGSIAPRQMLIDGTLPILINVHSDGKRVMELLYFTEPNDPSHAPICWIRIKRYELSAPECVEFEYRVAAISREADRQAHFDNPPSQALFLDALTDTLSYWADFAESGATFTLPEPELARVATGALSVATLTCSCGHAHYGHRFYGLELHDHFPPNYIFAIEAMITLGRRDTAREMFSYFLKYVLRQDGKINYRQGLGLNFGASAAEYGMLLHLTNRYRGVLLDFPLNKAAARGLIGMGEEILDHVSACEELDGLELVKMCAEADTNERIHVYLSNNLWAIRGLEALASLVDARRGERYRSAAQMLRKNVEVALERYGVKNTRFGRLPPFRLGYTPTPLTLSHCKDTFFPIGQEELERYLHYAWDRSDLFEGEDLIENTYANYRYYPEMLSAMLLPQEYSDAFVRMRESIGGELLGMTRFVEQIDDWPVLNYARFLIETGRIEKYLLLLYAHAAHHGSPELMTYYEQVTADGRVCANDCIPSLVTVPTMLAWTFAYETVEKTELRLLSALPKSWYRLPFAVKGLGYSEGSIDISSNGSALTVHFEGVPTMPVHLVIRAKDTVSPSDILEGAEYVDDVQKNVLVLKSNVKDVTLQIG